MKLMPRPRELRRLGALLWPHARPHRLLLASGAALSVVLVGLRVAQPWPLKWVLDLVTGHALPPMFDGLVRSPALGAAALSLLYVLVTIAAATIEYGQLLLLAGLGNRVLYSFRSQLLAHVLRQPLAFHEGRDTGELLTRIVYDTARLRQGVNGVLTRVFQTAAIFLATIAVLVWLDAPLAGVVAVSGVGALWAMTRSGGGIVRAARKQRRREGRLATLVTEDLLGIRELQTYRVGSEPDERFARQNVKSLKQEQKVRRLSAVLLLRVEVLLALSVTVILWMGAHAVQAGRLSPGALVLFVAYAVALYRPFAQFARQTARFGRTVACGERLTKILIREPAIRDQPGAVDAPAFVGALDFNRVAVRSPRRRRSSREWALEGVSFTARAGERVGIVGGNGAGKSTLLRVALRLTDPDVGTVALDGEDIRNFTLATLRRQVSVVFQDSVLLGLSVHDNIALGNGGASPDQVREAARRAHAHTFVQRLPAGYDTPVRHRGGLFSGGERQRIALARALLRDGRLWLLDEPTTSLDAKTAEDLVDLLFEATEGRTVLWVTHDPAILPRLDTVLVLMEGRTAFHGSPDAYGRWLASRISDPTGSSRREV